MKKILFLAAFVAASVMSYANGPRAIGANLGYSAGFSYQHGFGEKNMLDVAVSVPFVSSFGIGGSVTYDWIDPFNTSVPWNERGEWHWAMGVGGSGGLYSFSNPFLWYAGVAGHIGIAYDFWFPMELSLDWRPTIGVDNCNDKIGFGLWGLYSGVSLGIRYLF